MAKKLNIYTICCTCGKPMEARCYPSCLDCYLKYKNGELYTHCNLCGREFEHAQVWGVCYFCYERLVALNEKEM